MARRRKNLNDLLTPEPTPDRQLAHPSGWCITGHHTDCRFSFNHGKCGCSCHVAPVTNKRGRPKNTEEISENNTDTTDNVDPRPWKR